MKIDTNKDPYLMWRGLIWMALALLVPVLAFYSTPSEAGEQYVVATMASYHFDRSKEHNEQNFGLGYEYKFNEDWRVGAGFYKNSFYRHTNYVFGGYTPLTVYGTSVGLIGGLASGYTSERLDPLLGLFVTKEWSGFGVNVLIHPAALALQIKMPF